VHHSKSGASTKGFEHDPPEPLNEGFRLLPLDGRDSAGRLARAILRFGSVPRVACFSTAPARRVPWGLSQPLASEQCKRPPGA
jgi:hypothetical protein